MYETPNYAVTALLLPPTGLILLALFAVVVLRDRPRLRGAIVVTSMAALLALSLPIVAFALMRVIEPQPLDDAALPGANAIVILGGGRNRNAPEWGGTTLSGFTLQRVRYGARLARRTSLPILVSGGAPDGAGPSEGDLMRAVLREEFGVDARWNDNASRNTRENAAFCAGTLLPLGLKRIVLVSDGWHLARARREFERNGFRVIAAPTGLIGSRPFTLYQLVPNVESLRYAHIALRELLGGLWFGLVPPDRGAGG